MHELIILFVGLVAGFLGATVGGGGMIAIPMLLFLGFPPQTAVEEAPNHCYCTTPPFSAKEGSCCLADTSSAYATKD